MFFDEPIFFEKNRVFRVYKGGKLFSDFFGDGSSDGNYPEEWIASSVGALNERKTDGREGVSKIRGIGLYLDEAIKKYKKEILGAREDIGILTKVLDSAVRLPIQAHPDKEFSRKYFSSGYGKEESWIILAVRPGAKVYFGFKDGVTLKEFSNAVDASETSSEAMESLLRSIDVKVGDVIYIPAKTVHAIGAGCLILEVQEPTDFTVQPERWCGDYRLSDSEMYLGLDKATALGCFDIGKRYPAPLKPKPVYEENGVKYDAVIDESVTKSFSVNTVEITGGRFVLDKGAAVYVVIEGEGRIEGTGKKIAVKKGDYFLVPEKIKGKFALAGENLKAAECLA